MKLETDHFEPTAKALVKDVIEKSIDTIQIERGLKSTLDNWSTCYTDSEREDMIRYIQEGDLDMVAHLMTTSLLRDITKNGTLGDGDHQLNISTIPKDLETDCGPCSIDCALSGSEPTTEEEKSILMRRTLSGYSYGVASSLMTNVDSVENASFNLYRRFSATDNVQQKKEQQQKQQQQQQKQKQTVFCSSGASDNVLPVDTNTVAKQQPLTEGEKMLLSAAGESETDVLDNWCSSCKVDSPQWVSSDPTTVQEKEGGVNSNKQLNQTSSEHNSGTVRDNSKDKSETIDQTDGLIGCKENPCSTKQANQEVMDSTKINNENTVDINNSGTDNIWIFHSIMKDCNVYSVNNSESVRIIAIYGLNFPSKSFHAENYKYEEIMQEFLEYFIRYLENIKEDNYVIIYLHGGNTGRSIPSFAWLRQWYQVVNNRLKKHLKTLYIINPTIWLKGFLMICSIFLQSSFYRKIKILNGVENLTEYIPAEFISNI